MFLKFKNNILISCDCICGESLSGTIFNNNDGTKNIYIDFNSNDFYSKQGIFSNIKENINVICGKRVLKEIIVKKEDLLALKNFLLSVDKFESTYNDNDSHIIFRYDKYFGYIIYLISDLSKKDMLRFKTYRAYSLTITEKERDLLVYRINKIIEKVEEKK